MSVAFNNFRAFIYARARARLQARNVQREGRLSAKEMQRENFLSPLGKKEAAG